MSGVTRLTVLGCGSSGGVPRANGDWGECDPSNPKNRRRRCAAMFERAASADDLIAGENVTRIIIDTSPDFREQMIAAGVSRIDAVALTHDHADQTHGLDDLRAFALYQKHRIPVWMDAVTAQTLTTRFGYAFNAPEGSPYPPILDQCELPAWGETLRVDGPGGLIELVPFEQEHGWIKSAGFLCDGIAYSADISGLPETSWAILDRVACWIVDALRETPHPTHFSVGDALAALERTNAGKGVLTNLHITLDYDILNTALPEGVQCAFDGIRITRLEDGEIEIA